jgi:late competence protein required for DNA uptake (superfamily II DNA/RNA helicase)
MKATPDEKKIQEEHIQILLARWIKKKTDQNKAALVNKKAIAVKETFGNILKKL